MTQITRSFEESLGPMMPLGYIGTKQSATRAEGVLVLAVHVTYEAETIVPHVGNGRPIGSIIADREADPRRAAALARARRRLAAASTEDGAPPTLTTLRLAKGLSQSQLATLLNTQQSYIAKLEKGTVDMQLSTIKKLAVALGVTHEAIIEATEHHA